MTSEELSEMRWLGAQLRAAEDEVARLTLELEQAQRAVATLTGMGWTFNGISWIAPL